MSDPLIHVPSQRCQPIRRVKILPSIEQPNDPHDPKTCAFSWSDPVVQNVGSPHQCGHEPRGHKVHHDEESDSDVSFAPRGSTIISESERTPARRRHSARKRSRKVHRPESDLPHITPPLPAQGMELDSAESMARVKRELTELVEVASRGAFPDRVSNRTESVMPGSATDFVHAEVGTLRVEIRQLRKLLTEQGGLLEATLKERDEWLTKAKAAMDVTLANMLANVQARGEMLLSSQADGPQHGNCSVHAFKPTIESCRQELVADTDGQAIGSSDGTMTSKSNEGVAVSGQIDHSPETDIVTGMDHKKQSGAVSIEPMQQDKDEQSLFLPWSTPSTVAELDGQAQPEEISPSKRAKRNGWRRRRRGNNNAWVDSVPAFSVQQPNELSNTANHQGAEQRVHLQEQQIPKLFPGDHAKDSTQNANHAIFDANARTPTNRSEGDQAQGLNSSRPTREVDNNDISTSRKQRRRQRTRRQRSARLANGDNQLETQAYSENIENLPRMTDISRGSSYLPEPNDLKAIMNWKPRRSPQPKATSLGVDIAGAHSGLARLHESTERSTLNGSRGHIHSRGAVESKLSRRMQWHPRKNHIAEQPRRSKPPKAVSTFPGQASHTLQTGFQNVSERVKVPQTRTLNTERAYRECIIPQKHMAFWQAQCVCQELPDYFVDAANREPRLETWPWGREQFLLHCLQIVDCPGHLNITRRSCKDILENEQKRVANNQNNNSLDCEIEEGIASAMAFLADGDGGESSTATAAQSSRRQHSTVPPSVFYDNIPRFRFPPALPSPVMPDTSPTCNRCSPAPVENGIASGTAASVTHDAVSTVDHNQCREAIKTKRRQAKRVERAQKSRRSPTALPTTVSTSSPEIDKARDSDRPVESLPTGTADTSTDATVIEQAAAPASPLASQSQNAPKTRKSKHQQKKFGLPPSAKPSDTPADALASTSALPSIATVTDQDNAIPSTEQHDTANLDAGSRSQASLNVASIYRRHGTEPIRMVRPVSPATAVKQATATLFRQPLFALIGTTNVQPVTVQGTRLQTGEVAPATSTTRKRKRAEPKESRKYYTRHVPFNERMDDLQINQAGLLRLGYDRHISASYAFNKKGKIYSEYRYIADMKDAEGNLLWNEAQRKRTKM
ncbi:MAG: hypothetical protein Q9220_006229 [cf. Caloplaca sp. 1 TL-2023]